MDEPPGTRLRVALSALTMAEYFRDVQKQEVLLFIDNIFRFTQAGSEVSTLLGRMPSAVGYQPTLADEMGELQERITSVRGQAITSMQAIYVPADDYTDPAPATTFAHLDATTNLERSISDKGIYPAVDPLASSSRILAPEFVGAEHYAVAPEVKRILQRYKDLQDIIAILGMDELSEEDKVTVAGPAGSSGSCRRTRTPPSSSPASRARPSRSRRPSRRSRRSPRASTTTSPSRPSSCAVASTTSSATRPSSAPNRPPITTTSPKLWRTHTMAASRRGGGHRVVRGRASIRGRSPGAAQCPTGWCAGWAACRQARCSCAPRRTPRWR